MGKRVVICEDEGITQAQIRRGLQRAGLEVVGVAGNGQEAIDVTLGERPDIVVMDIRMPVMDGLEASERILAEYPVCILVLTAFANDGYEQRARAAGASGYVVKPVTNDILLRGLAAALEQFESNIGRS